jgi:hypothetical protein
MAARVKQLSETNLLKLYSTAKADGKESLQEVAVWIISVSVWWRSQGYTMIMKELERVIDE